MWFPSIRKTRSNTGNRARRQFQRPDLEVLEGRYVPSSAGSLDPTFGAGSGFVTQQVSPYGGGAGGRLVEGDSGGTLIQPNGDIIVDGTLKVNSSGTANFYLERLNPDGSLDTSFGNDGLAQASFSSGLPRVLSTPALYPQAGTANDGKIVVVGPSESGGLAEQVVERFNADGSVDSAFGNGGEATTTFTWSPNNEFSAVVVTPNGQVVALDYDASNHFELDRYNSNGSLDTTFGQGGQVTASVPNGANYDGIDSLLQQPDGELVVVTQSGRFNSGTWDLYAFNANGAPNTSFGNQGVVTTPAPSSAPAGPTTAAIYYNAGPSQDGQIVVLGTSVVSNTYGPPYTLVRFNANGSLDSMFGAGGIAQLPSIPNFVANLNQIALDAQGRVLLTGTNYASNNAAELIRVNSNGTLDSTFGNGGLVTELFGGAGCNGKGVAIEPTTGTPYDDNIVEVGGFGGNGVIFAARYLSQATTPYFIVTGPASAIAGAANTYTINAYNPNGSVDTSYSGAVHITSSDPQAVLPANFTISGGTATFSAAMKTAGTQSLAVTDATNSSITGSDSAIQINPAAASTFVISGFPSSVTQGKTASFTVTALDPYGNVATGYTGTVHFTSSDPKATLPANYTFTAANAGVHTFSVTFNTVGTEWLALTDTLVSSIGGIEMGIVVKKKQ